MYMYMHVHSSDGFNADQVDWHIICINIMLNPRSVHVHVLSLISHHPRHEYYHVLLLPTCVCEDGYLLAIIQYSSQVR